MEESNEHDSGITIGKNKLYVEDVEGYTQWCNRDCFFDEPTKALEIQNGIIFPAVSSEGQPFISGGVCNENGEFVDGHRKNKHEPEYESDVAYSGSIPEDLPYNRETVVYGGYFDWHYGHTIVEYLSRMWWLIENPDSGYKFVFISILEEPTVILLEFLYILGLSKEDIVLLKEPTRFDCVIVPDQTTYLRSGYKDKAYLVYDTIRNSVEPAPYEKVYFSRSMGQKDIVNEKYFEDYYSNHGYEVIHPEQLSINEQIAILAGLKFLACPGGTLQHQILLANNDIDITVLYKVRSTYATHFWINQFRSAKCTFVDVSVNFLPGFHYEATHLFLPTVYWKQYVYDQTGLHVEEDETMIKQFAAEYITTWTKQMINRPQYWLEKYGKYTLYDFLMRFHKCFIGTELDEATKKKLKDALSPKRDEMKRG